MLARLGTFCPSCKRLEGPHTQPQATGFKFREFLKVIKRCRACNFLYCWSEDLTDMVELEYTDS